MLGWREVDGGGGEERLVGICGGRDGSGGGSPLMASGSCSADGLVLWCCRVGDGEGGFGGEYCVAASTLCLAGDLADAIGDFADVVARREEEEDCLPNGGGGGGGPVWREMCRGDCEAECLCDPLLLVRTRHPVAAMPEEVEEELEWSVRDGEAVIIAPH